MKRHPNYIWDQLGEPRLKASLIADGFHLAPSVLRSMVWAKGAKSVVLTCDASGLAGCPPGLYPNEAGGYEILPEGRIVVANQRQLLAGSALFTDSCVATVVRNGAADLREAIRMVTQQPLALFNLPQGDLRPGDRSDIVLFRFDGKATNLSIVATISAGAIRYGALPR
jgi:N-acetylglucosamine-6-phosphate deacetylase